MIVARSLVFNVLAALWTAALVLLCLPAFLAPRRAAARAMRLWSAGIGWLLEHVVGLGYIVHGREHLPGGPVVIAANHQSAWETVMFHRIVDDPAFVLKRELLRLPTGWYAWRAGSIPVDRGGGARALRALVAVADRALRRGQPVVIFPQGTRTPPGVHRRFQPGVAALYTRLAVTVVPVALNSGLYWGRRTFVKHPGTVIVEILPAIPPGLGRAAFLTRLTEAIESAAQRLTSEVGGSIVKQNVNTNSGSPETDRAASEQHP